MSIELKSPGPTSSSASRQKPKQQSADPASLAKLTSESLWDGIQFIGIEDGAAGKIAMAIIGKRIEKITTTRYD